MDKFTNEQIKSLEGVTAILTEAVTAEIKEIQKEARGFVLPEEVKFEDGWE